jgi:signal transduction histidine kinase
MSGIAASMFTLGSACVYGAPTCPPLDDARRRAAARQSWPQVNAQGAGTPWQTQLVSELDDLRALTARLTSAADAERRRIERDLHDGVQQDLVALAVNLELARTLTDSDPDGAKKLLDEVRRDVQETLDDVRVLAHGIYPPILAARGLVDALRPIPAEVQVTALARYPLEVEQNVYFCCVELLSHVRGRATIRIWSEAETICFEVAGESLDGDDLSSVCDRLAALGGSLAVSASAASGKVPL